MNSRASPRPLEAGGAELPPVPVVQLCRSSTIDLTALRLDTGNTDTAVFAWTVCFHPKLAKVAVATAGCITEYDVISGCKVDSVELPGQTPVNLQYLGDGITLAFVTKERHTTTFNWATRRLRTLYVAGDTKGDTKAMTHMHLAVFMGARPIVYVSKHHSQAVRLILTAPKSKADKELAAGIKLYSTAKKPIIGIAAHPFDWDTVILAFQDGNVQAAQYIQKSDKLTTIWQVNVEAPGAGLQRAAVKVEKHPFVTRSSILVLGTNTGALSAWELPAGSEPRKLGHFNQTDGTALVGAGVIAASCLLVCFLKSPRGSLRGRIWRINTTPSGSTMLTPVGMTPEDVWLAIDGDDKPRLASEDMGHASFWRGLHLNGTGGFARFGGSVRSGYDVSRIVVHPAGYMMAQMLPQSELLNLRSKMEDKINSGAMEAVQRVLNAPVLRIWDATHPPNGSLAPDVVPLQTPLDFWTPPMEDEPHGKLRLLFPKDFTLLDSGAVRQYSLQGGSLSSLAEFPRAASLLAHRLVHSEKQKAWLIFFNAKQVKSVADVAAHGDSEYAIILQSNMMQLSMGSMDTFPGLAGTFCGASDEMYAILANDMRVVQLHRTVGDRAPLAVAALPGSGAYSLFNAGVLMAARSEVEPPRPATPPEEAGGKEERRRRKKEKEREKEGPLGEPKWALWAQAGSLNLVDLAAASGKFDLPDAVNSRYDKGCKRLGRLEPTRSVLLNATEKVLQVCWQPLGHQETASLAEPDGDARHSCLGAVATSERVLVVDGDLRLLSSNAPHDAQVQVMSCVWAGPALFFSTSAEEVYQFNWGGRALRCFALSSGVPAVLAGVLADRIFLATRSAGRTDVVPHYFNAAPALLLGWAGLAAAGVLQGGGRAKARKAMAAVLKYYDTSGVEPSLLAALSDAGFSDVALQALKHHLGDKIQPARLGAAVDACKAEAEALMSEYKASLYHPRPPPPNSVLAARLLRCGRKSVLCAALSAARNCFEAAGAVGELIPVLSMLNDKVTLRNMCEAVEVEATMMEESEALARKLYELPSSELSKIKLQPDPIGSSSYDGAYSQAWGDEISAPGSMPQMLAAYSATDRGAVTPMDKSALKNYIEMQTITMEGPVEFEGEGEESVGTLTPIGGSFNATPQGSFTMGESSDEEGGKEGGSAQAVAAPKEAATPSKVGADGFSDDSDDDGSVSASAVPKFRITIKSKDDAARGSSGGADLQRAAHSLRTIKWAGGPGGPAPASAGAGGLPTFLPPPGAAGLSLAPHRAAPVAPGRPPPIVPPPSAGFAGLGTGGSGSTGPSPATDGNDVDALLDFLGQSTPQPAAAASDPFAMPPRPQSGPPAAPSRAAPPNPAFVRGMDALRQGHFELAVQSLSKALEPTGAEAAKGNTAALEQFQQVVHSLAAAKLMAAAAKARPPLAAKAGRFAIMAKVPAQERVALVTKSVEYNMKVGNYGLSQEMLMWLVSETSDTASPAALQSLQSQLGQCDQAGGRNNSLPPREPLPQFVSGLSGCLSVEDVDRLVRPLLSG